MWAGFRSTKHPGVHVTLSWLGKRDVRTPEQEKSLMKDLSEIARDLLPLQFVLGEWITLGKPDDIKQGKGKLARLCHTASPMGTKMLNYTLLSFHKKWYHHEDGEAEERKDNLRFHLTVGKCTKDQIDALGKDGESLFMDEAFLKVPAADGGPSNEQVFSANHIYRDDSEKKTETKGDSTKTKRDSKFGVPLTASMIDAACSAASSSATYWITGPSGTYATFRPAGSESIGDRGEVGEAGPMATSPVAATASPASSASAGSATSRTCIGKTHATQTPSERQQSGAVHEKLKWFRAQGAKQFLDGRHTWDMYRFEVSSDKDEMEDDKNDKKKHKETKATTTAPGYAELFQFEPVVLETAEHAKLLVSKIDDIDAQMAKLRAQRDEHVKQLAAHKKEPPAFVDYMYSVDSQQQYVVRSDSKEAAIAHIQEKYLKDLGFRRYSESTYLDWVFTRTKMVSKETVVDPPPFNPKWAKPSVALLGDPEGWSL